MINLATLSSVEMIALILIVFSTIKIVVLLIKPQSWMNFAKWIWKVPALTSVIALALAALVLYYLIQSGLTIVQILATVAFVALLMAIGLASYVKDLIKTYEGQIKKRKLWKNGVWLYTLIWVVLLAWGIYVLFA